MPAESISTERSRLGTWASHLVLDFFVGRSHRFLLTITYSNHLKALVNTRFDAFQPCDLLVADGRTQQILLRLSQQRCMLKDHEKTGGFCFWKYVLEISKKLGDKMNTRYLCMYIYIYMRWYRIIYMNYLPTLGSLHITSHCFTSWVSAATPWASLAFFANSAVFSAISWRRLHKNDGKKLWDTSYPINCEVCVYLNFAIHQTEKHQILLRDSCTNFSFAPSQKPAMSSCHSPK